MSCLFLFLFLVEKMLSFDSSWNYIRSVATHCRWSDFKCNTIEEEEEEKDEKLYETRAIFADIIS